MAKKTKKKPLTPKAVPTDLFGKQISVLEKQFGDRVLESLASIKARPVLRTSSGSIALDYILSPKLGGMRNGRMLQLWGAPSCGKTTIALAFAANVTAAKKRVIFLDAEKTFDPSVAEAAGIDPDYFHVLRKPSEESINILYRILQTGDVGAVIIDSISALKPTPTEKKDKDLDITREQVAYHSNFISKWIDKLTDICADNDVLFICINQMRNQLGTYMGGTKAASGGFNYEHAISASIRMSGHVKNKNSRITNEEGKPIGQFVSCICDKSKIDMPQKEVRIPLFLGLGINPFMELAELAVQTTGVIVNKGAFYYLADDLDGGNIAQGMSALVNKLYQDNDFFKDIRSKVVKSLGLEYPKDEPFINPFLNADLTPKYVEYQEVEEPVDEPAIG